jgi:hypothetical protein
MTCSAARRNPNAYPAVSVVRRTDVPTSTGSKESRHGDRTTGCYVYGVVPADVEVKSDARGLGDPPGKVKVVRFGQIGALVGEIRLDTSLGSPEDLMAYEHLLDGAAREAPVIPVRFGAVMTDTQAVADELLVPYHDEFLAALKELEGRAEYVVKGRYREDALLREILSENPEIARQRDEIRDESPELTRNERIAVGEAINSAIVAKRDADTQKMVDVLAPHSVAVNVREAVHEEDAAHVAVLLDTERLAEIEDALRKLGQEWAGRVNLRLLGPLAPYDFVVTRNQMG